MGAEITSETSGGRPNLITGAKEYIRDVRVEMNKVAWPPRTELRDSTMVVIVMVILVSIFIGIVDRVLALAFEALVKVLG